MSRTWRWILPCYLFTLPMTIIGFIIALMFYRAHSWGWYDGVLGCVAGTARDGSTRIWGKPNAQTLGWIVIYDSEQMRDVTNLRVHEYTHVVQAFAGSLLGLVFTPLICMILGVSPLWGLALGGWVGGLGFAALYGILFIYLYIKQGGGEWYSAYRANPFENQAYTIQDEYLENPTTRPWGV